MRANEFARFLEAAKRDKTPKYREYFPLRHGMRVLCESKSQMDWWEQFTEALAKGHLKPSEFSFRELYESLVPNGREMIESWNPKYGPDSGAPLTEAAGAITASDFSNISGQIMYTATLESLTPEDYPFQALIPTQSTPYDGEKIPGITGLGDQAAIVPENQAFPYAGVGEDWIETPQTTKRGFIVPITKEALFFDRTGLLLKQASAVGEALTLNKEKRAIDCVIDENTTAHRYKWRGTTYATYQTTSPWDNVTAANALVDWTDIDNCDQTLNGITDPNTGEPVVVEADTLIVTKSLEQTAKRIVNATEVHVITPGYATTGNPNVTKVNNPMASKYKIVSSRLLASRLATDTDYFYGRPSKAFKYMENWPITVSQAPPGSSDDFRRDVVQQFKCSERGQFATIEPRVMSKSTVA